MKKTFKRAGVAVLSMAMLLSMGAATALTSSAATSVTMPATATATDKFDVYQIASSVKSGEAYNYTVVAPFTDLLEVETATGANKGKLKLKSEVSMNGTTLATGSYINDLTSHSKQAQVLAAKLDLIKTGDAKVSGEGFAQDSAHDLGTGYYMIVPQTTGASAPLLITVEDTAITGLTAKYTDVDITKKITAVTKTVSSETKNTGTVNTSDKGKTAVGEAGSTVAYSIDTTLPKYRDGVADIDDFTIYDIPEDTLTIDFGTDNDNINVTVTGFTTAAPVRGIDYTITKITDDTTKNKYKGATASAANDGFKVVFTDNYVVKNPNAAVSVTFNATLAGNETVDLNTDSNNNKTTLSYSNNYDTGKGDKDKPGDETPKEKSAEADIYCTLVNVNKLNESASVLKGATFKVVNKATGWDVQQIADPAGATGTGTFEFKGLTAGTYKLVEVAAPANYTLAPEVEFTVNADGTTSYNGTFTFTNTTSGNTIEVTDHPGQSLPGTGGMGTILFTVGGAAIVLLAGALFVLYMRKRETEE